MAANLNFHSGSKRAHTQTMTIGLQEKSQQNRANALGSCHITAKQIAGLRNLPGQLIGCVNLRPSNRINLNFSIERAQGQLLSSWSKSGALQTNNPR
jgi:hypothetical protein